MTCAAIIGTLMTKGGRPVELVDTNQAHVRALNAGGACISGHLTLCQPVRAILPEQMRGHYDLMFLLNKQTANPRVLSHLGPHLHDDSTVCTLQNGIPEPSVASILDARRVIGGTVGFGATWLCPGHSSPTADPAVFDRIVPRIRDRTDAVINITTGCSTRMTLDERLAYPLQLKPEMCSLNMGSMNFSIHPAARKIQTWRYPWEKPYIEGMEDMIFRNTFRDIKYILRVLGDECGTLFEFECYDVGHLHNLRHFVDEGLIKPPFFIQTVLGILGGLCPDSENLMVMRQTADRLSGRENYRFSVLGAGRHQMPLLTMGAIMGGNVRVGLEDSLFLGRSQLAQTCAQQVYKIRRILSELSLDIATPGEARQMLAMRRSPSGS